MLAGTTVLLGVKRRSDLPPWLSVLCVSVASVAMTDLIAFLIRSVKEALLIAYVNGDHDNRGSSLHQILLTE